MARTSLPPGFRFHPTDVELIMYYLKRKVTGKKFLFEAISEVNIYKFSPWDLPDKSSLKNKDLEWFFFCPRERKYASGVRMNRATETGYWKTTGKDRPILYNGNVVGSVKTLVFHQGHAPKGERTDWVIHEYRIHDKQLDARVAQDAYVLCKVFQKSGPGPKNGAQYGAPFKEEDWDDDAQSNNDLLPSEELIPVVSERPQHENPNCSVVTNAVGVANPSVLSEPCPSSAAPPAIEGCLDNPNDDLFQMLACFTEDALLPNKNENNENRSGRRNEMSSDWNEVYHGLEDLIYSKDLCEDMFDVSGAQDVNTWNTFPPPNDASFLELNDLDTPLDSSTGNMTHPIPTSSLYAPCNSYSNQGSFCCINSFHGVSQCACVRNETYMLPEESNVLMGPHWMMQETSNGINGNQEHNAAYTTNLTAYGPLQDIMDAGENQERGRFHSDENFGHPDKG